MNEEETLSHEELLKKIEELEQEKKLLQQKNEELESFAYIASHDLQEPLRKIQTFSKMILDAEGNNFSEKAKDQFRRIVAASSRMQKFIDTLLQYSRTKTDEKIFVIKNLAEIFEEAQSQLAETAEEKNATIEINPMPDVPIIPHQFLQLAQNLLANSLKYARENVPPIIKINAEETLLPSSMEKGWKITIADNGIGFDEQYREKIFELFQRLHGKQEYEGVGMGLSICKKIVENHGGTIEASGKVNEGMTVTIFIPGKKQP